MKYENANMGTIDCNGFLPQMQIKLAFESVQVNKTKAWIAAIPCP